MGMTPEEEAERIAQAYRDFPHENLVRACVRMKSEIKAMSVELRKLQFAMKMLIETVNLEDQVEMLVEEISKES